MTGEVQAIWVIEFGWFSFALQRFGRGNRPAEAKPGTVAALDAVLADPLVRSSRR